MTFKKGDPRPKGAGRRKGTPNKRTVEMQGLVRKALEELGGEKYLVELGRKEPAVFASLLRRLIPQTVEATIDTRSIVRIMDYTARELDKLEEADPERLQIPEADWRDVTPTNRGENDGETEESSAKTTGGRV